jgi:photosystem II stability/assembly factor-like uncharacterized protein
MAAMRVTPLRAPLLLIAVASARARAQGWQTYGPPLFDVNAVAAAADDATAYAASSDNAAGQSAIFRTPDGGRTWTPLVQAASGEFYSALLVDPFDSETLYTGAPAGDGTTKIYWSGNSGSNWVPGQTIPVFCIPSLAAGATAGSAFVSCGTYLYSTVDGGRTWRQLLNPFTEATRLASGPGGMLVAYGPTHIFRSADAGVTWTPAGSAPAACPGLTSLRVSPANPGTFVAGTGLTGAGGFQCGGVYRSSDGGAHWTGSSLTDVYVTDLAYDPNVVSRVYASAGYLAGVLPKGGVFQSLDGGATWSDLDLPQNGAGGLALSSPGDRIYAATSLGVYQLALSAGTTTCVADDVTLCLDGARFRVRSTWTKNDGSTGPGHAAALTSDTGDFWFFDSSNIEVIVKVLEGCSSNSHRWVFAGGLTNVLVTLTVTDMVTGAVQTYTNPQGTPFAPIQDTSAFPCN